MTTEIIPQQIIKNLTDKRNQGAEELEVLIRKFIANKETENLANAVQQSCGLTNSVQPNLRKAGLWAISAICIALMTSSKDYLTEIIPCIFLCMKDQDSKVRFHACEAMYNVSKAARGHILEFFPKIFIAMCKLSADSENTIKNANTHLNRLIKDILTEDDGFKLEEVIPLIQERVNSNDPYVRQFILGWIIILDAIPDVNILSHLPSFLSGIFSMLSDPNVEIVTQTQSTLKEFLDEINNNSESVDIHSLMKIILSHSFSQDNLTRETSQLWVNNFITIRGEDLISFDYEMIQITVSNLSHKLETIKSAASATEKKLFKLIKNTKKEVQYDKIIQSLSVSLESSPLSTRVASLNWINLLLKKDFEKVMKNSENLLNLLTETLIDPSEEVLILDLENLSFIAATETTFSIVILKIMKMFKTERKLLSKSGFIIRKLCIMLNPEKIYCEFGKHLLDEEDFEFSSSLIQILNTILLTSKELADLRQKIRKEKSLFELLFKSWCYNPISTLSLCLLAKSYQLSNKIVMNFGNTDLNLETLVQIDNLVQLLESPIFSSLRLELLEPYQSPDLLKTLYGILMILPQSTAYDKLNNRLQAVSTLAFLESKSLQMKQKSSKETEENLKKLLNHFEKTQGKQKNTHSNDL
eukprot:gene6671-10835_t